PILSTGAYGSRPHPSPQGATLQRMKPRLEPPAAHTATAHKIAVIFYAMIKNQTEYDGTIWEQRDAQRRQKHTTGLKRQALRRDRNSLQLRRRPLKNNPTFSEGCGEVSPKHRGAATHQKNFGA